MPGTPRDKAWAQRMVVKQGGRPHRMMVWCLLLGLSPDAWRGMSREEQREKLLPFVMEGEVIRFTQQSGEGFIVPETTGGMGRSDVSDRSLDSLQMEAATRRSFERALGTMQRSAYQQAYAEATSDLAIMYVELERKVLMTALAEDASPAERKMAMAAWKDWKDRHMGKPVAPVEDVTTSATDIRTLMASAAPALPASSSWTVEQVAEEARRELEAGSFDGTEVLTDETEFR